MLKKSIHLALSGHCQTLKRVLVTNRTFSSATAPTEEEYARRNYARNLPEYNTVISSLTFQRKNFLLRDAYEDMVLDGVKPDIDTFHSLLVGTMKGARLQDAFFFRDEMKAMGLFPDVPSYNFLISTCGKCKHSDAAIQILEEMKNNGVKPNGQTYICLLNACAATGRIDQVYAIVRDMTAAGLGLNKFCYAGLVAAHVNRTPRTEETLAKIIDLVEQSKGWSSVEGANDTAENVMIGVSEEELYNVPTAEFVHRRGGFVFRDLTVYHVALLACADLQSIETMERLLDMLAKDRKTPDIFIVMQTMRCYLCCGDLERGLKTFEDYISERPPVVELYVTLMEGAMVGHTERGMQIALDTLEKMTSRGFFLNYKMGSDLLLAASGEKGGGYTTANYIWDLMQERKLNLSLPALKAYHKGLMERDIAKDDPRLLHVSTKEAYLTIRAEVEELEKKLDDLQEERERRTSGERKGGLPEDASTVPAVVPSPLPRGVIDRVRAKLNVVLC
ncbi:hypothetical protein IFM89_033798 [Coptis chinensis]|uniref:Pentatricopeptide repeat-containing protein n=1 Tax=Coptis chinensis TaxID=261450 RepID=A0A835HTR0_9MAGN|nr:hypothetical protein IFM89_033798 [Coptis chinensis]